MIEIQKLHDTTQIVIKYKSELYFIYKYLIIARVLKMKARESYLAVQNPLT